MDLSRVIVGPIVTEKAERLKGERSYTFTVADGATKVEVVHALKRFYDVDAESVRVMRVRSKVRAAGPSRVFTKRSASKKAMVTISSKSKPLDLAQFRVIN